MSKKDNDDTAASGSMMESVLAIAMGTEEKRYGLLAEHVLSRIGPVLSLHATLFPEDFRTESDVRELNGTFDRNDLALPWGAKDLCHWNTTTGYDSWKESWERFVDFLQPIALARYNIFVTLPDPNPSALINFQYPAPNSTTPSSPPSPSPSDDLDNDDDSTPTDSKAVTTNNASSSSTNSNDAAAAVDASSISIIDSNAAAASPHVTS
jgi:hypothetical protein